MTASHWHVIINHLPIIGTCICALFLLMGLILKNNQIKLISIGMIAVMTVFGFIAHKTGENAEHSIQQTHEMHEAIEAHEEAAKPGFIMHNIAGILALVTLALYRKKKIFNALATILMILCFVTVSSLGYAGYLGGKIRHSEEAPVEIKI
jgi:uncharacterized membrane protein